MICAICLDDVDVDDTQDKDTAYQRFCNCEIGNVHKQCLETWYELHPECIICHSKVVPYLALALQEDLVLESSASDVGGAEFDLGDAHTMYEQSTRGASLLCICCSRILLLCLAVSVCTLLYMKGRIE